MPMASMILEQFSNITSLLSSNFTSRDLRNIFGEFQSMYIYYYFLTFFSLFFFKKIWTVPSLNIHLRSYPQFKGSEVQYIPPGTIQVELLRNFQLIFFRFLKFTKSDIKYLFGGLILISIL